MPRSSEATVARFGELVPTDDRVQRKQMFCYPCAVVGGHLFMSLHGDDLVLRLPESEINALVQQEGFARFEPMAGRPMKGFVAVDLERVLDPDRLDTLVESAFAQGLSMPAKTPKARAPRKAARPT